MPRLTYANIVSTIALVIAAGGGTYAVAAAGDSGTIKGCSSKKTGALRVLSGSKKCKVSERALSWNVKGAPGAAGIAGVKGADGTAGIAGAAGADGAQGPAGNTGPDGTGGAAGPIGPTGPAGSADTGSQILTKLAGVDGAASGLDADLLDGFDGAAYGRQIATQVVDSTVNIFSASCSGFSSSVPAGVLETDYLVADWPILPSGTIATTLGIRSVTIPEPDIVAVFRICNISATSPISVRAKLRFIR